MTSEAHANSTIGLVTSDIANNGTGYVTTFGRVRGVNTNAWNEGDALYLSATAGQLTNVKPTSPNWAVRVGWVEKKSGDGVIFVSIQRLSVKASEVIP